MNMKKIALGLATCGLILSSCSSNDVFEDNQGTNNPNAINFSATTTRATVNTLKEVQGGFPVYAVKKDGVNNAWHINGRTYKFDVTWKWDGGAAEQWPNAIANYPMNFYAYYPATHKGYAEHEVAGSKVNSPIQGDANSNSLSSVITIQATAEAQADYLAANTTGIVNQMSTVPLQFKHITTKINFGVIAAAGTKSYVQQMNINNVKNQGTFNYVTDPTVTDYAPWTIAQTEVPGTYDYYGTTTATVDTDNPLTYIVKDVKEFTNESTSFYDETAQSDPKASEAHLMLLPQKETAVWTPAIFAGTTQPQDTDDQAFEIIAPAGKTITPLKAYIGSVYRMTDNEEKDLVGYKSAENHPNWKDLPDNSVWKEYKDELFVKVGFPLTAKSSGTSAPLTWDMGKGYTYNIVLGEYNSSGGYILDNRYYDKYGRPTDLTIDGKNPGDPVLGGDIHFHVTVGEWENATPQPNPIQ